MGAAVEIGIVDRGSDANNTYCAVQRGAHAHAHAHVVGTACLQLPVVGTFLSGTGAHKMAGVPLGCLSQTPPKYDGTIPATMQKRWHSPISSKNDHMYLFSV